MALVGVADRDGVYHDVLLAKPLYLRAPAIGEVLTIGEDNDCPSLRVLLGVDGLERHIQSRAQVGLDRVEPIRVAVDAMRPAQPRGFLSVDNKARRDRRTPPRPHGWPTLQPVR